MGSAEMKYGSIRKHTTCTSEKVDGVEELVFGQNDAS